MNRTRTMALAGALMLGGWLGVGTPAVRAQAYADPARASGGASAYTDSAGGTYYSPAPGPDRPAVVAPAGYPAYPSPDYAAAAGTTTAPPPTPVDDPARIATLEDRIRALESQHQAADGPGGAVIRFIDERGW